MNNRILELAGEIGQELVKEHGRMVMKDGGAGGVVQGTEFAISEDLMTVIAEILQAWLNAGSEREVTLENEPLSDELFTEVQGWTIPDEDPNFEKEERKES